MLQPQEHRETNSSRAGEQIPRKDVKQSGFSSWPHGRYTDTDTDKQSRHLTHSESARFIALQPTGQTSPTLRFTINSVLPLQSCFHNLHPPGKSRHCWTTPSPAAFADQKSQFYVNLIGRRRARFTLGQRICLLTIVDWFDVNVVTSAWLFSIVWLKTRRHLRKPAQRIRIYCTA